MNGPAFLRPRNFTFWAYAIVVAAALFWRGPQELAGASGGTVLLWAAFTCAGAAAVAVFGWALDPHATLPRSLVGGGFGWGAACAVLVAQTDRESSQLLVKLLGVAKGGALAHWLAVPLAHAVLAILGTLLLLSLAGECALRPTDGMKLGMSCGFGMWSGALLLALTQSTVDNPTGGLAEGLPHWFALAAAPWAAPAVAGYGFHVARAALGRGRLRRLGEFAVAALGSAALACLFGGAAEAALAAGASGWSWAWTATAGFGLAFAVLLPARAPAWWTAIGFGVFGAVASIISSGFSFGRWPVLVLAALSPLALLGFWRRATQAEGAWLSTALADESDAVRTGCAQAGELIDLQTRRSAATTARAAFGPKARALAVRLRAGQIRLANGKALLAQERKDAGPKPDAQWRTWLAHLAEEVDAQRGSVRDTVADMAREEGVYQ